MILSRQKSSATATKRKCNKIKFKKTSFIANKLIRNEPKLACLDDVAVCFYFKKMYIEPIDVAKRLCFLINTYIF